ncbi:MAG: hypothetical protein MI924_35075 [Chloroflexales bacterium]|nr:hypothetical protein [Chloroflexales bacterium]
MHLFLEILRYGALLFAGVQGVLIVWALVRLVREKARSAETEAPAQQE